MSATQLKKTVCGKRQRIIIGIENILNTVNKFGISDNFKDLIINNNIVKACNGAR